jgi:hypothetical protein
MDGQVLFGKKLYLLNHRDQFYGVFANCIAAAAGARRRM